MLTSHTPLDKSLSLLDLPVDLSVLRVFGMATPRTPFSKADLRVDERVAAYVDVGLSEVGHLFSLVRRRLLRLFPGFLGDLLPFRFDSKVTTLTPFRKVAVLVDRAVASVKVDFLFRAGKVTAMTQFSKCVLILEEAVLADVYFAARFVRDLRMTRRGGPRRSGTDHDGGVEP